MSLTRVSPALFQVSNNITSVTVGGSANTVSLTFDSNGVITGASNNALSVANTQITGLVTAAQIATVANTQITGLIEAAQIGSANATLVTSGTLPAARLPAGSVLQVVQATFSTFVSTTSASATDTGLTATITPSSASSKILVLVNGSGYSSATTTIGKLSLVRTATTIITFSNIYSYSTASAGVNGSMNTAYLDSPATTSATTYKVQWNREGGAGTMYLNNTTSTSTIVLMEIQG